MNADDYETLPTQSMGVHMMAGACAGVMEHCVMYSVDCVKTRRQILTPGPGGGAGIITEIGNMIRQEGILRPFRGISAMVAGAGPAHALYFSCYEHLKNKLMNTSLGSSHLVYAHAGAVSTALHDGVMNPAEVVKQRMQMPNSPYRSVTDCIRHVYAKEGLAAFYRSYSTTLVMNVPFQALHFVTYEFIQSLTNPQRLYDPKAHILSGGAAGAVAATVSMPFDVCKTLLNTQVGEARASGMVDAGKLVYRYWGLPGFFRGLSARIIYQVPATAICWTTYEFFKYLLQNERNAGLQPNNDLPFTRPQLPAAVATTGAAVVRTTSTIESSLSDSGTNSFQGTERYFSEKPVRQIFDVSKNVTSVTSVDSL